MIFDGSLEIPLLLEIKKYCNVHNKINFGFINFLVD